MPNPQPDAREVEKQFKLAAVARQIMWLGLAQTAEKILSRFADECRAEGREEAAKITADLNVGIATTPEGEAWNSAIRKAVAAIHAGATP